jgi:anti-sigma B factor antagonist
MMGSTRRIIATVATTVTLSVAAMAEIRVARQGSIEAIAVTGELDVSNVAALDEALGNALSGTTKSCLLDLSEVAFMDSSVIHTLIRWSKEAQVSAREGLAIMVGDADTQATRVLTVAGLMKRLPVFSSGDAAMTALKLGQKPRWERPLSWLTDLELLTEREEAQASSDAATRRLDDAIAEQTTRRDDADTRPNN